MSTYTQLQADITDILASTDINTELVIRLAEDELDKVMRLREMVVKTSSAVGKDGDRYTGSLPPDLIEIIHIEQNGIRLEYRTPNAYWHEYSDIYTITGKLFYVTGADNVDIWYYSKPTSLSPTVNSNAYSSDCYSGLLYLALSHAALYMGDVQKQQAYRALGLEIAMATQEADKETRHSGAPLVQR